MKKPGKVQAIAIYTLVLGILNMFAAIAYLLYGLVGGLLTFGIGCLFLIPVPLLLATGILEIVYAMKLLPDPIKPSTPNRLVAILEICCVLSCNVLDLVGGILSLVFYQDPEVVAYFDWSNSGS